MIRLDFMIELKYEIVNQPGDFIFNVHAAKTPCQTVIAENFQISQPVAISLLTDTVSGNRQARLQASLGTLIVRYAAMVEINHHIAPPNTVKETPISQLPTEVLPYIYPSRYCQSDRMQQIAHTEFGHLPTGYSRVLAIQNWVRQRTKFVSGSSNAMTSAIDTLSGQAGVCRDFAHLMIVLCRALNMPARFATSIDYGSDPIFGPTDFHAYVEVYLGERWYLFDPTGMVLPMGLIRIGTGRDAADVSFAMIFGDVRSMPPIITISSVENIANNTVRPYACNDALSTDMCHFQPIYGLI